MKKQPVSLNDSTDSQQHTVALSHGVKTALTKMAKSVKAVRKFYHEITYNDTDLVFKNCISKGVKVQSYEEIK